MAKKAKRLVSESRTSFRCQATAGAPESENACVKASY